MYSFDIRFLYMRGRNEGERNQIFSEVLHPLRVEFINYVEQKYKSIEKNKQHTFT